jgi:hypothetical protein
VSTTYPITVTRQRLTDANACPEGLAVFDALGPDGGLSIANVAAHQALLASPLAVHEKWGVGVCVLPPIQSTAGDYGTATAGYRGRATAGDYGTATAGEDGTATAGYRGTATAGEDGTATAGDYGTATAGERGTATAGDYGTATARQYGTATAGERGTATAGYRGTATAGEDGTATAGYRGTATAGERGMLCLHHFDGERRRLAVAYVGEGGIEADVPYRISEDGAFEKVTP